MKLFTKYGRINLLATVIIFLIASVAYYFTLHFVLVGQIDQDLEIEEEEIVTYSQMHNRLPEPISVPDQIIHFNTTNEATTRKFTTIPLWEEKDKSRENFRQLIFGIQVNGKTYSVTVAKSLEETDKLLRSILIITLVTISCILVVHFIINRVLLKKIWKPFYQSLDAVKQFKVSRSQSLPLPDTKTDEFQLMNDTLRRITQQAHTDYLALKTFSENASHEIQTPIAIIRSKLDLLIQDERLAEHQGNALQAAYHAIEKLSRLNQSLLLMAKIENKQFEEMDAVDLKKLLDEKIEEFQELWATQQIHVSSELSAVSVKMNNELADVLLNNLLSNATKYNYEHGNISIALSKNVLSISNTSIEPPLAKEQLYKRFFKSGHSNGHNGLGLSIIKEICDASGFEINYKFSEGIHQFKIRW